VHALFVFVHVDTRSPYTLIYLNRRYLSPPDSVSTFIGRLCRPPLSSSAFSFAVSASPREEKCPASNCLLFPVSCLLFGFCSSSNPYQLAYVSCTAKRKKFRPLFGFRTAHQVLCLHSRVYRAPIAAGDRRRARPRILFVSICVHSWSPVFSRSARPQSGSRFGRCFGDGSPSKSWSLRGTSRFSLLFRVYILPA